MSMWRTRVSGAVVGSAVQHIPDIFAPDGRIDTPRTDVSGTAVPGNET
jgi:hypothetical protein